MKKYYKNPTKRAAKKVRKTPIFNKEQLEFYNGFYENLERLESEWNLCREQYDKALVFVKEKGIKFDTKMALQKISKYWNQRKLSMERVLDKESLQRFKDKRNERERLSKKG